MSNGAQFRQANKLRTVILILILSERTPEILEAELSNRLDRASSSYYLGVSNYPVDLDRRKPEYGVFSSPSGYFACTSDGEAGL